MRLGAMAHGPVLDALREDRGPAVELLSIAAVLATPDYLDPALARSRSPEPRVRVAAVELLRTVAGAEAVRRLVELLADSHADVRRSAAQSVGTLGDWRAGRALVPLLGDDDDGVRLAAAIALTALGPPGMLLLRDVAAAPSSERSASVARQVLDVAETLAMPAGA
jgi:HEAT repeat protein